MQTAVYFLDPLGTDLVYREVSCPALRLLANGYFFSTLLYLFTGISNFVSTNRYHAALHHGPAHLAIRSMFSSNSNRTNNAIPV